MYYFSLHEKLDAVKVVIAHLSSEISLGFSEKESVQLFNMLHDRMCELEFLISMDEDFPSASYDFFLDTP